MVICIAAENLFESTLVCLADSWISADVKAALCVGVKITLGACPALTGKVPGLLEIAFSMGPGPDSDMLQEALVYCLSHAVQLTRSSSVHASAAADCLRNRPYLGTVGDWVPRDGRKRARSPRDLTKPQDERGGEKRPAGKPRSSGAADFAADVDMEAESDCPFIKRPGSTVLEAEILHVSLQHCQSAFAALQQAGITRAGDPFQGLSTAKLDHSALEKGLRMLEVAILVFDLGTDPLVWEQALVCSDST